MKTKAIQTNKDFLCTSWRPYVGASLVWLLQIIFRARVRHLRMPVCFTWPASCMVHSLVLYETPLPILMTSSLFRRKCTHTCKYMKLQLVTSSVLSVSRLPELCPQAQCHCDGFRHRPRVHSYQPNYTRQYQVTRNLWPMVLLVDTYCSDCHIIFYSNHNQKNT